MLVNYLSILFGILEDFITSNILVLLFDLIILIFLKILSNLLIISINII